MSNDSSFSPNKVLPVSVTNIQFLDYWPYNDGSPWWAGGASPRPYRWQIDITVSPQQHSSNLTREAYEYNGLDIFSRDWIVGANSPNKSLEIVEVIGKTETTATLIVEDKFRYNTFLDSSQNGSGIFSTGNAVIFELSVDGMPKLDPLPVTIDSFSFSPNTSGRFRRYDLEQLIQFSQTTHGFSDGDVISVEPGLGFVLATSDNSIKSVGRITEAGPGPNFFSMKAFREVLYLEQHNLPGVVGDFLYVDETTPGKYSITESGSPVVLILSEAVSTTTKGSVTNPTVSLGNQLKVNGIPITFSGSTLASVVSDFNGVSGTSYVTADIGVAPTSATTALGNTAFGGVFAGVGTPASATINGTLVTFNNDTASPGVYGNEIDVAKDINDAAIPNITASASGGLVTIIESSGATINIVNVSPDNFGNNFAGPSSISGLALSTPGSTDQFLTLENADGTGIILQNVNGTPLDDLGIVSADNGTPPIGMSVSGGLRQGIITVVADLTARDALSPAAGDQAFVIDSDDGSGNDVGEWSNWLWDGSQWVMISNQDSSNTDAKSVEVDVVYNDASPVDLITLSDGRRIVSVVVEVTTIFNLPATLKIGDVLDPDKLMTSDLNDLSELGTYSTNPDFVYANGSDVTLRATLNNGGSSQGNARIVITYV